MLSWRGLLILAGVVLLAGYSAVSSSGAKAAPPSDASKPGVLRQYENPESYGAIAFSPSTKQWRMRWDVADQQQAIDLVMTECKASDCRTILVYGQGVCGTFALGANNALGVGAGSNVSDAEKTALAGCFAAGDKCKAAKPRCNK